MTAAELRFYPPFQPRPDMQRANMAKTAAEVPNHRHLVDIHGVPDLKGPRVLCPSVPYENWVKKCGSVVPLCIKTTRHWRFDNEQPFRVDPNMSGSEDRTGYMHTVRERKTRAGWLRVADYLTGKDPTKTPDILAEEITKRRAAHAERAKDHTEALRPMHEKLAEAISSNNRDSINEIARTFRASMKTKGGE